MDGIGFIIGFFAAFVALPIVLAFIKTIGFYTVVEEGTCVVYELFGKVLAVIKEPGLHILPTVLGPQAFIVGWLGKRHILDMRLDQVYLRSQPVNSEEGAPMGIGIWYEMFVSDPQAFLYKNSDPRGSLAANVSNATVRCLSNLSLERMLENRHVMSQTVRHEVSAQSAEWGYKLGSVYIRKVHFRDGGMIHQIEQKVVNRLRQVTSAIQQDGANQVSLVTSTAERRAATEFARAAAIRPQLMGEAMRQITTDPEVATALFDILETQQILEGKSEVVLLPQSSNGLAHLLAADLGRNYATTEVPNPRQQVVRNLNT
jgi:regulator of protease activity HflC (stomatin/prohibitin superfamily)